MRKKETLSAKEADKIRKKCQTLYKKTGPSAVYDYANEINLPYHPCKPCEAETPTITDKNGSECAVCGSNKDIALPEKIMQPKEGYDATIETEDGIFHLRNFTNVDPDETGVDIYTKRGRHIGQLEGMSITFPDNLKDTDEVESYLDDVARISERIEQEL